MEAFKAPAECKGSLEGCKGNGGIGAVTHGKERDNAHYKHIPFQSNCFACQLLCRLCRVHRACPTPGPEHFGPVQEDPLRGLQDSEIYLRGLHGEYRYSRYSIILGILVACLICHLLGLPCEEND